MPFVGKQNQCPPSQASWIPAFAGMTVGGLLRALIRGYQLFLSPFLGGTCRYTPSCSRYAEEAVRIHGPWRGGWLAVRRLLRCHPWGGNPYDPVP